MLSSEQRSELKSKLQKHAVLCVEQSRFCKTEEATKQSLVLRFFSMLGYDVFNMQEVIPEFSTGFSDKIKKRADYVIAKNGEEEIEFDQAKMIFDFGGAPAGFVAKISKIIIQKHKTK